MSVLEARNAEPTRHSSTKKRTSNEVCRVERAPPPRRKANRMRRSCVLIVVTAAVLAGPGAARAGARPAADPPARASAKPCLPARGLVVAMTIRRRLQHGSGVTEPLADGGYRITRCDTQGRTTIGMTVLPIADTGGLRRLLPAVIVRGKSIIAPTYGDPGRDTRYRRVFHRGLRRLLAGVLARTPGSASRDPSFAL